MAGRVMRSRDLGDSLDDWGRFLPAPSVADRAAATPGDLVRGVLDRTQLDLITIDAPGHVVSRTRSHIERAPERLHVIAVQERGRSVLEPEDGPPLTLRPGDIAYWTSDMPYRWEFDGPFQLLELRAPLGAFGLAPADLEPLVGRTFRSDRGFARHAVAFARGVLNDPGVLVGQAGTRILQNVIALFATMLVGELDLQSDGRGHAPAFRRVVGYIADHLAEPLDLRGIAAANGMSTRYLQSLFQERGMTVSRWIRMRRLDAARQALADPALASLTVGQVAALCGFPDHAHFTRAFRAAFDQTPSSWRAEALRDAA